MNIGNYHLTETGIVYRASVYWDELQNITAYLNQMSERLPLQTFQRLSTSFILAFFLCFLSLSNVYFIFLVGLMTLVGVTASLQLFAHFLLFKKVQKKGNFLYNMLKDEYQQLCIDFPEETSNMDYKVTLEYYAIAQKFPLPEYLYLCILLLIPFSILALGIGKIFFS